jgi:hypothetical protein
MKWLILAILLSPRPKEIPKGIGTAEHGGSIVADQDYKSEPSNNGFVESIELAAQRQDDSQNTGPSDQDEGIQRRLANYTRLLVVVAAITGAILIWQAVETHRSVDTANRNVIAVMDERRARIRVIANNPALIPDGISNATVQLRNVGPTVAFLEANAVRLLVSAREVDPNYSECTELGFVGDIPGEKATPQFAIITLEPSAKLTPDPGSRHSEWALPCSLLWIC